MKKQGIDYLRTQPTKELQKIINMVERSESMGYESIGNEKELSLQVLKERGDKL